jgi:hypothetical protein
MMRRLPVLICGCLLAVGVSACASTTASTAAFKGEAHAVAQTISNLQSDATAGEEKKVCERDVSSSIVARLGGIKGCEQAIKNQLAEVDSLTVTVQSVKLGAAGAKGADTAHATVTSVQSGKTKPSTVALVKEAGKWKISGVG